MSLNTSHANSGVLIFNSERILIYHDGVEMNFDMNCNMPHFKGSKKGRIYLTTHRVIFNNKDIRNTLQSFSMPFRSMREVELEQPIFGANYIKGVVIAENGGNWEGTGKFKLKFNEGGAIEFGQALIVAGKMASRNRDRPAPQVYNSAAADQFYQAPPPAYAPPSGPQYEFVPYATFPTAPPANGVYMTDAPPPYPGIDPNLPPYAATTSVGHAPPFTTPNQSKAQEAAASAYYNPSDPQNVYAPANYPTDAPPAYSEATKKYN